MNKEQALQVVGELAQSAVHHYAVVNGDRKGKASSAADKEMKVARRILEALCIFATNKEIEVALGW